MADRSGCRFLPAALLALLAALPVRSDGVAGIPTDARMLAFQAAEDSLYIGTDRGLFRLRRNAQCAEALPVTAAVVRLAHDQERLLAATGAGLIRWQAGKTAIVPLPDAGAEAPVADLVVITGSRNRVFAGGEFGLAEIAGDAGRGVPLPQGEQTVTALAASGLDLFVATENALHLYHPLRNLWHRLSSGQIYTSLCPLSSSSCAGITPDGGVEIVSLSQPDCPRRLALGENDAATALAGAADGALLVGTWRGRLLRSDASGERLDPVAGEPAMPSAIRVLSVTPSGLVAVGLESGGIHMIEIDGDRYRERKAPGILFSAFFTRRPAQERSGHGPFFAAVLGVAGALLLLLTWSIVRSRRRVAPAPVFDFSRREGLSPAIADLAERAVRLAGRIAELEARHRARRENGQTEALADARAEHDALRLLMRQHLAELRMQMERRKVKLAAAPSLEGAVHERKQLDEWLVQAEKDIAFLRSMLEE